jgi:hypothetical protein
MRFCMTHLLTYRLALNSLLILTPDVKRVSEGEDQWGMLPYRIKGNGY